MIGQLVLPTVPLSTNCHQPLCVPAVPGLFHVGLLYNGSVQTSEVSHLFSPLVLSFLPVVFSFFFCSWCALKRNYTEDGVLGVLT